MQEVDTLAYIDDRDEERLYYHFTPALYASNFVPLIVVLCEQERAEGLHFGYKMWNVLTPLLQKEQLEILAKGTEDAISVLLQNLIGQFADEYECEEDIYLYGGNAGGEAAVIQGTLCKANAVFAVVSTSGPKEEETGYRSRYLSAFAQKIQTFPIFYLCGDEADRAGKALQGYAGNKKIQVYKDFCPDNPDEVSRFKAVLDMFEHVPPA